MADPMRPSRRQVLLGGAALATAGLLRPASAATTTATAAVRKPGSLPHPGLAAGTVDASMPFDHIVIVMMENRSFDHYFGHLSRKGQPRADGFTFDEHGVATNSNPLGAGYLPVFSTDGNPCTAEDAGSQSWNDSHEQIARGQMNGFAATGPGSMAYFTDETIPFYYSLAKTFCLANRWFCSVPAQTYPNRRFLMAGTAYGNISTSTDSIFSTTDGFAKPPPNGTIFDQLHKHGISWKNYFTDLPGTAIIPSIVQTYPTNVVPVAEFFADCAAGTLPSVSYVDPEFGVGDEVGGGIQKITVPTFQTVGGDLRYQNGDEENPADIQIGESFMSQVVNAVMHGPAWPRTLLVYLYDEHGGFYDHVPPPKAIKPDSIAPKLKKTDYQADYSRYGPRVPAIVVSPYSKPNAVTDVVHDHTSTLATIQAKWNLPALTYRDANAATVMDFLDVKHAHFLTPPTLVAPLALAAGEAACLAGQVKPPKARNYAKPVLVTHPSASAPDGSPAGGGRSLASTGLSSGLAAAAAGTVAAALWARAMAAVAEDDPS